MWHSFTKLRENGTGPTPSWAAAVKSPQWILEISFTFPVNSMLFHRRPPYEKFFILSDCRFLKTASRAANFPQNGWSAEEVSSFRSNGQISEIETVSSEQKWNCPIIQAVGNLMTSGKRNEYRGIGNRLENGGSERGVIASTNAAWTTIRTFCIVYNIQCWAYESCHFPNSIGKVALNPFSFSLLGREDFAIARMIW